MRPETLIEKGVGSDIGFVSDVALNVVMLSNNQQMFRYDLFGPSSDGQPETILRPS